MASPDPSFGSYRLGAKLAQGGMAEIYRAQFQAAGGISKHVIIKRILPSYAADARFIEMFTNEAQIAMGLSHGNIAQVFDFGEIGGTWFLAMELVDGPALSKVLKRARAEGIPALPPELAVLVTAEMLKGLHYAHTRLDETGTPLNIVHRDVSPQNVLVSYEGQVKLVDFGIAKARYATDKTRAGVVKGKYLYFSPEQVREKPLDARTDVFAAGTMLYQLLTGVLPFQGEMVDVLRHIVRGEFTPPTQVEPAIPADLEAIVLTAMSPDLGARYQSAAEFEQALTNWLHLNAPNTTAEALGHFVSVLFAEELKADGRNLRVPPEAVDEVNALKRAEPVTENGSDPLTKSDRGGRSSASVRVRPATRSAPGAGRRVPRVWLATGAVLLALAVAVVTTLLSGPPLFELRLTSDPAGATVHLDGSPVPGLTPLAVKGLDADRPHLVRVEHAGMKSWDVEARGTGGAVTFVHAELQALAPVVDAGVVEAPPPAVPPPEPDADGRAPLQVYYPDSHFEVRPRRHFKLMAKSNAAHIDLDPHRTYQLSLEGKLSFGGKVADIWVEECIYFLEGPALGAHQTFGVLDAKPIKVTGATRLYAFVNDTSAVNHNGAFKLRVRSAGLPMQTMLVDSKAHELMPEADERLTVSGLNLLERYSVKVTNGPTPARTRKTGRPGRVLYGQEAGVIAPSTKEPERKPQRLLEAGKTYEMNAVERMWFWFPDDDVSDNEGSVEVQITRLGGLESNILQDLFMKPAPKRKPR